MLRRFFWFILVYQLFVLLNVLILILECRLFLDRTILSIIYHLFLKRKESLSFIGLGLKIDFLMF